MEEDERRGAREEWKDEDMIRVTITLSSDKAEQKVNIECF